MLLRQLESPLLYDTIVSVTHCCARCEKELVGSPVLILGAFVTENKIAQMRYLF